MNGVAPCKVFGIGFHKTATSSLANALYTLGYNVTGYFSESGDDALEKALRLAGRYDAAQDTPWFMFYRELDEAYPDSKFVLTVRDPDRWINSVTNHFHDQRIPVHEWIYGVEAAAGNEDVYLHRYRQHNDDVREYFRERPDDLLVMDIAEGDGWELLCPFLGVASPPLPFPRQNVRRHPGVEAMRRVTMIARQQMSMLSQRGRAREAIRTGVSAEVIRDVIHVHYASFGPSLAAITTAAPAELMASAGWSTAAQLLLEQIAEERSWLMRLMPDAPRSRIAEVDTPDDLLREWERATLDMRRYVADLTHESLAADVRGHDVFVWEVLMHVASKGIERRARVEDQLANLGVPIPSHGFLDVVRPHR